MNIKGKVHCFFEQSGTFKNEFRKLGYEAEDYDIQNDFGETDNVIDLFKEIEKCYGGGGSLFDRISKDDLILAFFPCVYFESLQQTCFDLTNTNYRNKSMCERIELTLERLDKRTMFHALLYKLFWIAFRKRLRLIIENPATEPNYLMTGQNFPKPTIIDRNRMLRGDYFVKPTAYWFVNCEPTYGRSFQKDKVQKTIMKSKGSGRAGICSSERSMMSLDYARNFICDFILGQEQKYTERLLF
nr:MAG TPA: hypothetical protein [Bacteriophage sp.]